MPTSTSFLQICVVPFVQRAEKMSTSANYLHSWTNADLIYVALKLSKNYFYRLLICASDSTLPILNIFWQNCSHFFFLFSFPPVNFCQFTVIDYYNCKAAGQQISSQQDLPIPSLQRQSKTGLLSLSLYLQCFFLSPKGSALQNTWQRPANHGGSLLVSF